MSVGPLRQRTMPDGIADALRRSILSGELAPGAPLRESHLAAQLGVSRSPLREALRTLEDEGLVQRQPFKGSAVATVTPEVLRDIAAVRQCVEPLAVESGLEALREDDGAALRAAVESLAEVAAQGDMAASIDAHLAVHRLFYELSGNTVLMDLWRSWESRLRLFWVMDHQAFPTLSDVAQSHYRLLELVLAGDRAAISKELHTHVLGWVPVSTDRHG